MEDDGVLKFRYKDKDHYLLINYKINLGTFSNSKVHYPSGSIILYTQNKELKRYLWSRLGKIKIYVRPGRYKHNYYLTYSINAFNINDDYIIILYNRHGGGRDDYNIYKKYTRINKLNNIIREIG